MDIKNATLTTLKALGKDEKWLQDWLVEDPQRLGIGNVVIKAKELRHYSSARIARSRGCVAAVRAKPTRKGERTRGAPAAPKERGYGLLRLSRSLADMTAHAPRGGR